MRRNKILTLMLVFILLCNILVPIIGLGNNTAATYLDDEINSQGKEDSTDEVRTEDYELFPSLADTSQIPLVEGNSSALEVVTTLQRNNSGFMQSAPDTVRTPNIHVPSPENGTNSQIVCDVDNLVTYRDSELSFTGSNYGGAPPGGFDVNPFYEGSGWEISGYAFEPNPAYWTTGWTSEDTKYVYQAISASNSLPGYSFAHTSATVILGALSDNPYDEIQSAYLQFNWRVCAAVAAFTEVTAGSISLSITEQNVAFPHSIQWSEGMSSTVLGNTWKGSWVPNYQARPPSMVIGDNGPTYNTAGATGVVLNLTDILKLGSQYKLRLSLGGAVQKSLLLTWSELWAWWDNIHVLVTYKRSIPDTQINNHLKMVEVESNTPYSFDSDGITSFDTNSENWYFRKSDSFINEMKYNTASYHFYFDFKCNVTSLIVQNPLCKYSLELDDEFALWNITTENLVSFNESLFMPLSIGKMYVPPDWQFLECDSGTSLWNETEREGTILAKGWFRFNQENNDIDNVEIAQQDDWAIIRNNVEYLMPGEQYAVIPHGNPGNYYLEIYSRSGDSPFEYLTYSSLTHNNGEIWYEDVSGILSTWFNRDYLITLAYNDSINPLHVGFRSTIFSSSTYWLNNPSSVLTENTDGSYTAHSSMTGWNTDPQSTMTILGSLIDVTNSPKLYVLQEDPIQITENLFLEQIEISDSIISGDAEIVHIGYQVKNNGSSSESVSILSRLVSMAGTSYVLGQKTTNFEISSGTAATENWFENVDERGIDTTLRNGVYRLQLIVSGTEAGIVFVDEYVPEILFLVSDNDIDGHISSIHEIQGPSYSTTFEKNEIVTPESNYIIISVVDSNHITLNEPCEISFYSKLNTYLTDPEIQISQDGVAHISTVLSGQAPNDGNYNYTNENFTVSFFVDWGSGFQYLGNESIPINETAGITLIRNISIPEDTYVLRAQYIGDSFTDECTIETEFGMEQVTILTSSADIPQGESGIIGGCLEGATIGILQGYTLNFTIFNNSNWQWLGDCETNETGWACIDFLAPLQSGTYLVNISFSGEGFIASTIQQTELVVLDTILPTITIPDDITLTEGTWVFIEWTPSDQNPESYTVYRNGSLWVSGLWNETGEKIRIPLAEFDFGIYNLTIICFDQSGNFMSDEVIVQVLESPSITVIGTTTYDTGTESETGGDAGSLAALGLSISASIGIAIVVLYFLKKRGVSST